MYSCTLPPALLAEWLGSFTCHCGKTDVERISKQNLAQKVDPGEEHSPAAPAGTRTRDLSSPRYPRSPIFVRARACVCVCACVCVRACVCVCVCERECVRACVRACARMRALACLHACVLRTRKYACVTSIPHAGLPKFASAVQRFFTDGLALGVRGPWPHVRRPGQQCVSPLR